MMSKKTILLLCTVLLVIVGAWFFITQRDESKANNSQAQKSSNNTQSNGTTTPLNFDKAAYSTSEPASIWIIVNKKHPLSPITYAPGDLITVGNGQLMRSEAATALASLFTVAKAAGLTLTAASGYRSYTTQVAVYNNEVKSFGQARADSESARAGYSEHQTGLAVDIAGGGCSVEDCFGTTAVGKWAAANAYTYGFILRYTPEDTNITGYRAESWHFRYVGTALALELHNQHIATLEEFFGVSGGPNYN